MQDPIYPSTTTEYRVIYKRVTWQKSQSRKFESPESAERFLAKLTSGDRDYPELEFVRIDQRDCDRWAIGANRVKHHE